MYQVGRSGQGVRLAGAGLSVAEDGGRVAFEGELDDAADSGALHRLGLVVVLVEDGVERVRLGRQRLVERRLALPHAVGHAHGARQHVRTDHHHVRLHRLDYAHVVLLHLLRVQRTHPFI